MTGKHILVTGANKGIGFEIARQLLQKGNQVIIGSRSKEKGAAAVATLEKEGLKALAMQLDVTDADSIATAVAFVKQTWGRLDVLINNAGILLKDDQSLLHTPVATEQAILQTNAIAPLHISRVFAPLMPAGSTIVMMSSGGGSMTDTVGGWSPLYCISKSMLNAISRHLHYWLQPEGIAVHAMCPGWVKTDMGGAGAPRSVAQGADTAVWLSLTENIPGGNFWRDRKQIPW
jgi:NAD(P)-dependent dehydrogenase (short-subunit alcohol dehydrogenase family)